MGRFRRGLNEDQGASAVEFALVALILVMLLTGITQFGMVFFQYLEVSHSAREGARWASLGELAGSVAQPKSVRGRVSAAAPGLNPGLTDAQIVISVDGTSRQTAALPGDAGKPVAVTVNYESPVFMPLMSEIVGGNTIHLQSTATLRVE
ncbi:MAG: TadE/TadG family type IV pilus assembly protein [Actinomycetota bacterium]|nr:TadE/TadG family type IV pilus assembly protein [Actinomycetota bacterium]